MKRKVKGKKKQIEPNYPVQGVSKEFIEQLKIVGEYIVNRGVGTEYRPWLKRIQDEDRSVVGDGKLKARPELDKEFAKALFNFHPMSRVYMELSMLKKIGVWLLAMGFECQDAWRKMWRRMG